jgi:excisionase family DNA binding protein
MQGERTRGLATVAEAQRFLSVSRSTLYRMLGQADLRSLKVRGARRIRWADLEAFVNREGAASACGSR